MRTLASLDSESRKRIAEETLHIYAPIANRLGMWSVMAELEDLSFAELHPKASARIASDLERAKPRARAFIVRTRRKILKKLGGAGLGVTVQARMKHLYSIFSKMERKGYDLQRLHDIFAFRVVTQSEDECYRCLSLLHDAWKAAPGRVKDYISRPKPNGYQSLHTILLSEDNLPFEVQIRTQSMHRIAESGVAAHALYKTARSGLRDVQRELLWIQRLKELAQETDSMDAIRTSLREEEIFVLTPGRDIIALPRGATILDFAYRIHTDVGHRTSGALVHDRMVPLATELKTGDVVTILTHPKHRPSRDWLSMVVTADRKSVV